MMNRIINKFIKLIDRIINIIVIIILLLFIIFSSYALYDSYYVYNGAKLSDDIKKVAPTEEDFSLASLEEINPDICGWIRVDNTNIDYPVLLGEDNSEYLNRDYKRNYSTAGSIFLDYRNEKDFSNDYIIIYGHNLNANLMFSDIKKFADKEFFDNNSTGKLYTNDGVYNIDIYTFGKVNAFSDSAYNLMIYKDGKNSTLINGFGKEATHKRDLEFKNEDKVLLLSTCDSAGSYDRVILVCRLSKASEEVDEVINKDSDSSLRKIDRQGRDTSTERQINDSVAPRQTVRVVNFDISVRDIVLAVLFVVVVIIFIFAFLKKRDKDNEKKNKK